MMCNNPKLDLFNVDAHKKIGQSLSICSQGIERTRNSEVNQGLKLCQKFEKMIGNNPKLDLVSVDVHTNFGQILKILSGNEILTSTKGRNCVKILQKRWATILS